MENAGVVKLVDAPDSKSGGAKTPCRFDSGLRHLMFIESRNLLIYTKLKTDKIYYIISGSIRINIRLNPWNIYLKVIKFTNRAVDKLIMDDAVISLNSILDKT